MKPFIGVKIALIYKDNLLVYLRDNKPGLRFAGLWDFFGGGRENEETPYECVSRELDEELKIQVTESQIIFSKVFPAMHDPSQDAYFMAAKLTDENVKQMSFGSEGQRYHFVSINDFFNRDDFVPELKGRMRSYLQSVNKE